MFNVLLYLAGSYLAICVIGRLVHRSFVYVRDPSHVSPKEAGMAGVEEVRLTAPDGAKLFAWYQPAQDGQPTLLYCTGNGGSTASRTEKFDAITGAGYGLLMLNYRGFGGSDGRPTEAHNKADAVLAYDWLRQRGLSPDQIVAYGESLGTSVATSLAVARRVKALVLEAPLTSTVDVGRRRWWFLPLRFVLVDQYRTIDVIGQVHVPLLIVHGIKDRVIPISQAQRLYAAANEPKIMQIFPEADHGDLYEHGAFQAIDGFLRSLGPAQGKAKVAANKPAGPARQGARSGHATA